MATDLAQKWLIEHEPSEIREAAKQILRGEYVGPAENRFADMPPEDLVIEWLRDSSLESEYREAILGACKETLAQSHVALVTGEMLLDSATLIRLCRIVDVAAPQELYGAVTALLTLVLRTPNVPASVVTAAVRAGMAYRLTKEDMPLWEVVASRPETAAYGVNALLRIAPDSECIPKLLVELWIHQLADGWNVDVPFLVRMAARNSGDGQLPHLVVQRVQELISEDRRNYGLLGKLRVELNKKPWSREWQLPQSAIPLEIGSSAGEGSHGWREYRLGTPSVPGAQFNTSPARCGLFLASLQAKLAHLDMSLTERKKKQKFPFRAQSSSVSTRVFVKASKRNPLFNEMIGTDPRPPGTVYRWSSHKRNSHEDLVSSN